MSEENKESTTTTSSEKSQTTESKGQDLASEVAALKATIAELMSAKKEDKSILEKVRSDRETKEKEDQSHQELERALTFTLSTKEFYKNNQAVLPTEVLDIIDKTEKEKFDTPLQKSRTIKSAIMESFFSVQSNLDLLTPSHKKTVEDFFKLSKNGRESKSDQLFDNVFEPTVEMLKRVKKAEEVAKAKSGYGSSTDAESAYKNKMIDLAKKRYLRERANA
jgi:hypothetical protein